MPGMQKLLDELDFEDVHANYDERMRVHRLLRRRLRAGMICSFVELALGIDEPSGNFSAHEHGLGRMILAESEAAVVFDFAKALAACPPNEDLPSFVQNAGIPYLKIGVGSEMACLLRPKEFWVTNVRTIWAHLVLKHHGSVNLANEELGLYRDSERDSEMEYEIWGDLHRRLAPAMRRLGEEGASSSQHQGLIAPSFDYLWADAVANGLYEIHSAT